MPVTTAVLWFYVGCLCVHPSVHLPSSIFSFLNDNFSKNQLIFTKFGMCINIVKIWFESANGQISSFFLTEISSCHMKVAGYYHFTFFDVVFFFSSRKHAYRIYPKYSDTSTPYHICSKILTSTIHYPMLCLKIAG